MGGNITCIVVILIPELAKGHSLTLESMKLTDPLGTEI